MTTDLRIAHSSLSPKKDSISFIGRSRLLGFGGSRGLHGPG